MLRSLTPLLLLSPASASLLYGCVCITSLGEMIVNTSRTGPPVSPASCPTTAYGSFNESMNVTGWSYLTLHSVPGASDEDAAYSTGYLEATLTATAVLQAVMNTQGGNVTGYDAGLAAFLTRNDAWVRNASRPAAWLKSTSVSGGLESVSYWHHVRLALRQQDGMYDGYVAAVGGGAGFLTRDVFDTALLQGDLIDLCSIYACSAARRTTSAHCSVLVKPVGEGSAPSDVYIGHTTWSGFETMLRMYKHYDMPLTVNGDPASGIVPGRHVMFSGYPGNMVSLDDWYVLQPSGLVVTETTITNVNASAWALVDHKSVLEWTRNVVANRLAVNGSSWMGLFSAHNSGTYNNAWHVLDTSRFTPSAPPQPGFLTMGEQMPGVFLFADMTPTLLAAGYWASYNVPYFPLIFQVSGYQKLVDKYGEYYSWGNTSRARLFARLQGGVVDDVTFRSVMRHNQFATDVEGLQACTAGVRSASNAIAERGDLTPKDAHKYCLSDVERQDEAAIDVKYTSVGMLARGKGTCVAQSGPTYESQPPFVFSTSPFAALSHEGMPDAWMFPYVTVEWDLS